MIPHPYAFNLFPHNSPMTDSGYCEEEVKMLKETRKIFHDDSLRITATCVRVPVLRAHCEALNIEFEEDPSVEEVYAILRASPGVEVLEDRGANRWPMPIDASGKDPVLVGRVRRDQSAAEHPGPVGGRRPDPQGRRPERRADRRAAVHITGRSVPSPSPACGRGRGEGFLASGSKLSSLRSRPAMACDRRAMPSGRRWKWDSSMYRSRRISIWMAWMPARRGGRGGW